MSAVGRSPGGVSFGPRRALWTRIVPGETGGLSDADLERLETFDLLYRTLCAILYNYAPLSGHPGGSISSGRIVAGLLFGTLDYDVAEPWRCDADVLSYAAGHKALGLYAMWALRDEVARLAMPDALPAEGSRLRLEDLLGFRRNPVTDTPLFRRLRARALDGHPTPATPFVSLATGASGVGLASSLGLALAAADVFRDDPPRVHVLEGEGGLTPGRVSEALAFAGTASLANAILHVDWNQSSIDSDRVTREGDTPGDYVQWDPMELLHLHDWNVVEVGDGSDFRQVLAGQRRALEMANGQPTAVVYRTTKGWRYGLEGRASHGAGHPLCSPGFHDAVRALAEMGAGPAPSCESGRTRCQGGYDRGQVEACFWEALGAVRAALESRPDVVELLGERTLLARLRLDERHRSARPSAPYVERAFGSARQPRLPERLALAPGARVALRTQLGRALGELNRRTGGAFLVAAADLLESTAVSEAVAGFPKGYLNLGTNPDSRTLSVGGIAEDAMAGVLSGVSSFGWHVGVGSSYGAFIAPLGHVAARLHAIGSQARRIRDGTPQTPFVMICGHAGLETGEDGPTHADPQALQLLQENFPPGTLITLTPWEPGEVWTLLEVALAHRPAVIAPFVTRPKVTVPDREALGLAPADGAARGIYRLRAARGTADGTVVLQGSGVAYAFVEVALPLLLGDGVDLDVYLVTSAELFAALPERDQRALFGEVKGLEAMGITGFTAPTLHRWIRSELGRSHSLHPFQRGHFLGSGPGETVLAEAGLDGVSQYRAVLRYVEALERARTRSVGVGVGVG